jgi:phage terminase large subunit-like protein
MPVSPRLRKSKRQLHGDEAGKDAIAFIEQCCVHTIGKWDGRPFKLTPWQRDFTYRIFSNVDGRGMRLTRRAYLEIARKNGKSDWAAAIALLLLCADGEASPEVYGAACDRDQASIVFNVALKMATKSEALRNVLQPLKGTHRILCPGNGGFYRTIPADAVGALGFNASGVVIDEFATQKSRDLYDALSTSMVVREQPLIVMITTAGFEKERGPCYEIYEYAKGVEAGTIKDKTFIGKVYELPQSTTFETIAEQDERGNFTREKDLWTLANPSLIGQPSGFVKPDEIRRAVAEAIHLPRARNHVLNLHFNIWTDAEEAWLPLADWDATAGLVVEPELHGRPFYGGLDLSHTQDFTAWCLLFPPEDEHGPLKALWRFWIPEDTLLRRGDMKPLLDEWAAGGFIRICPGAVVDHREVEEQIRQDCKDFELLELAFDNFHSYPIVSSLEEQFSGQLADCGQTYRHMNMPAKEVERLVSERRLNHGGNPVVRWMMSHAVAETNQDDLVRISRKKSSDKVDGVVSLLMATSRYALAEAEPEVSFISFSD